MEIVNSIKYAIPCCRREGTVSSIPNFEIIKPLIHVKSYMDEDPISYLMRLVNSNSYNAIAWMIFSKTEKRFALTHHATFYLLKSTAWLDYKVSPLIEEIVNFPAVLLNKQTIKFCPECLMEKRYYRMQWQRKSALVCLVHKSYLQEYCPECLNKIPVSKGRVGYCICGADLSILPMVKASQSALNLQLFIERKSFQSGGALTNVKAKDLSLADRDQFVIKLASWSLESILYKDKNNKKMPLSLEILDDISFTFFGSQKSFMDYLLQLNQLEIIKLPSGVDNIFVGFYRYFYRNFECHIFDVYKKWIENFILQEWKKPITHRNSFFSHKLIKGYPWITIEKASKSMRLAPSDLYRAIEDGRLLSVSYKKLQNTYTLVYRPNLFVLGEYLTEIASFTRAMGILKITKKQLYELLESGFFPDAVSPQRSTRNTWIIPQSVLEEFIDKLYKIAAIRGSKGIAFGTAMRVICGRIPQSFASLLRAILEEKITIFYNPSRAVINKSEKISLQSFTICKASLEHWISTQIKMPGYFTIPEFAIYWDIHQEFAYQLVNLKLINHEVCGRARYIRDIHMIEFKSKYTILTHFVRERGYRTKNLPRLLESSSQKTIDYDWDVKLRQKVYLKGILESFSKEELC